MALSKLRQLSRGDGNTGHGPAERVRALLLSLVSIFFYLYWLATSSRPTGNLVCLHCGYRWRA